MREAHRRRHLVVTRALAGLLVLPSVLIAIAPGARAAGANSQTGTTSCTGVLAGLGVYSGTGQVAKAGSEFAQPLEVEAVDTAGCPLANEPITFELPAIGPSAAFAGSVLDATVETGSNGVASSPTLTADDVLGSFDATAVLDNYELTFPLTITTVGAASTVTPVSGGGQSAAVGTAFPSPLSVRVTDAYGDPVSGQTVSFQVLANDEATATFSSGGASATAVTDQNGLATSPSLTAGTATGTFTVTASVAGANPASFSLADLPGQVTSIEPGIGTSQTTPLGTDFGVPLAVTVTDADGNPLAGVPVTFSAPKTGATGVFAGSNTTAEVVTDAEGIATAPPFSAGLKVGGYIVAATVPSSTLEATFALSNEPRTSASAPGPAGSYLVVTSAGKVMASGSASAQGGLSGRKLSSPVAAVATLPQDEGYWLVTKNGKVYPFGDALRYGNAPSGSSVVAMSATSDGKGYWLVTSKGKVYPFGDAVWYGSAASAHVSKPIVGMAVTPDGKGYWLVTSGGAVYGYGDARFAGPQTGFRPGVAIVGIAASAKGGYWLVASTGAVFAFGGATNFGSGVNISPHPVVALLPTADAQGYWLVSRNGTVAGFGDAGAQGSPAVAKGTVVGAAN